MVRQHQNYFPRRYQEGLGGLSKDTDMASHYASLSAAKASEEFHKVGAQPIMESDRITDATELVVGFFFNSK